MKAEAFGDAHRQRVESEINAWVASEIRKAEARTATALVFSPSLYRSLDAGSNQMIRVYTLVLQHDALEWLQLALVMRRSGSPISFRQYLNGYMMENLVHYINPSPCVYLGMSCSQRLSRSG